MSLSDVAVPETASPSVATRVVNDFSIQVATVNGSGSQTANLVLLRSLFQMGVPVSGKNMFPSNIAGLPTWYTIRANKDGYVARKKEVDFLVAMNPETAREDVLSLGPGSAVLYDEPLKLDALRTDLVFYPVPFDRIVGEVCKDAKLRRLVKNMIYDGVLSKLLNIDLAQMEHALKRQMGKKQKAIELNMAALEAGAAYTEQHLPKRDPYWAEPMDKTSGMILVEGNAAGALGCMMAGVTVVAWYPITPSSSLPETLISYLKKYRKDPETGKATYAVVQAEDEIASIGMVHRRRLGGGAGDDVDVGSRHFPDGGVRRDWRTTPRCPESSSTSSASAPRPGFRRARRRGICSRPRCSRTATRSRSCCCRRPSKSATRCRWMPSISRSASSRSCSS